MKSGIPGIANKIANKTGDKIANKIADKTGKSSKPEIQGAARQLGTTLESHSLHITAAESCTGGLIAKSLTDIDGSSGWFEQAWVTYSNKAKNEMLGVSTDLLQTHGAVSGPVVEAMAAGALHHANASLAVAVSGIAGPGGGSLQKPVGTVWIAWASSPAIDGLISMARIDDETVDGKGRDNGDESAGQIASRMYRFEGDRESVREQAALTAIIVSGKLFDR